MIKIQKLYKLQIYRELFSSEFDKNCFYAKNTYLSIQSTVSVQKLCNSISQIDFLETESVSCVNKVFYITAYCNRAGSKKRFYWLKIWELTRNSFIRKELILSKETFLSYTENTGSGWEELRRSSNRSLFSNIYFFDCKTLEDI